MDFFRKRSKTRVEYPAEPIPVGEAQESDWAAWEDSVAFQDSLTGDFQETAKMELTPQDTYDIDVFASVTRKGA